jgi:hypothetical protein
MLAIRVLAWPNRATWPAEYERPASGTGFMIMNTPRPYYGLYKMGRTRGASCIARADSSASRPGRYDLDHRPAFSYPPHPMKTYSTKAMSLGAIAVCLFAGGADELSLAPRAGVLLLNNGELIEGTITASGDRYDVSGSDSEIRIKRSDVAFAGRDAHECYLHKRAGIEQGRVQDHLELTEWCLKNGLVEPAEKELAAARASDSRHPKIRLLEPRLELAKQAPREPPPPLAHEKAATSQLDVVVRNLPGGSMENFTNGIQPMLLNYCAKSGCHGPRSSGLMKLERIPPNRLAGRHATQSNLQAVLAMINRETPQDSKLLSAPIRPHGNLKLPVFTDREQSQYKQLVQWVYQVSNVKPVMSRAPLEERTDLLLQNVPRPGQPSNEPSDAKKPKDRKSELDPGDWSESFPDQVEKGADGHSTPRHSARGSRERRPIDRMSAPSAATTESEYVPKDPFDPEIFNRRFFAR